MLCICSVSNSIVSYTNKAYMLSPHAPRAKSYNPSGTGCRSVSKVAGFCILLTESDLISSEERDEKSTLLIAEGTGWEIFILASI